MDRASTKAWMAASFAVFVLAAVPAFGAQDTSTQPAAPAQTPSADTPAPDAPVVDPVVARGQYLAAAGDCISCHTVPGSAPFAGGRAFETPLGTLYSSNITPDPDTGIGKWTEADLARAMHEGVAPGGARLYPAFPYTAFTKVTDEDVHALYTYLRTLAPVKAVPPANGILFRQRWGMMFWNALFFKPGRYTPDAAQSEEWNRGAYLVEGLGHCGACHSPRNLFMAESTAQAFAGGHFQDTVAEGKVREWSGVNLTPANDGLAKWAVKDIVAYLKNGFSVTRAGVFGPMNDVIVNSTHQFTDADIRAIATYLKSLPARPNTGTAISADQIAAGKPIYEKRCESCHGGSGRGGMFEGPPLDGSAIVRARNPASLINAVLYGAATPPGVSTGGWETMQPFAEALSDADVANIANYIRGSWDNGGSPVTAADVARQR